MIEPCPLSLWALKAYECLYDLYDDSLYYEFKPDDMTAEEAQEECLEFVREVNRRIEMFLGDIDEKYGTDYCPSGATRV